jgi:hypothetical protein
MKRNCWEFHDCGREIGGGNASSLGICPAAVEGRLHGVHDGKNAGRACWVVAGTLCGGEIQGNFGKKFKNCEICDFYKQVKLEENASFTLSINLLNRLKNGSQPAGNATEGPVVYRNSSH